jgi:putative transposase
LALGGIRDDVPTNPPPVTDRQTGIDVGIVSFATTSDGEHVDNPRWGRQAADRLATAQQRLARAKRCSRNRVRWREAVAARHHKIANQRKDFHHKQAPPSSRSMTFWWWRIYRSPA